MIYSRISAIVFLIYLSWGCSKLPPMETVDHVDLDRFMGRWYVIAAIPTYLEKGAHNPVESYEKLPDGTIGTTFSFNKGSFDGDLKTYSPRGFVLDSLTNAVWAMQFIWPFKADYRIIFLDEDYRHVMIGRKRRDYLWIMARDKQMNPELLEDLVRLSREFGYESAKIFSFPHSASVES